MVQERLAPTTQVRQLPYKTLKDLADLLDLYDQSGANPYWKSLVAELPSSYNYTPVLINKLSMQAQKPGGSSAMTLLNDFGTQLMNVAELITYLEAINHQEALLLVKPHEPVYITRHPQSVTVQAGQDIILTCEATSFPRPAYQWFKNNFPLQHKCSSELKLKEVREDAIGEYLCKVTNPIGSEFSATAQVQVIPAIAQVVGGVTVPGVAYTDDSSCVMAPPTPPLAYATVQPPELGSVGYLERTIFVYMGQSFQLTCNQPAHTYQWYRNSYPLPECRSPRLLFRPFNRADEGYYCCLIDDGRQQMFTELAYLKSKDPTLIDTVSPNQQFATGKLALLIANQNYIHSPRHRQHNGRLVHPIDDAKLLHEKLETIGFKVITLSNLTKSEMKSAVAGFCELLTCAQHLYSLFYFCGHGFEEHGKTYLVPIDMESDWNSRAAISAEEILADIQSQGTTNLDVLILDVCRTLERNNAAESFGSINPPFKAGAQCVVGYATCPQSQSFEVHQHRNGIYMKHLAAHITENIQIEHLLHKVNVAVRKETEKWSATSQMSPTFNSTTTKVFSLCDGVLPAGFITGERDPEVEWFEYHRLPAQQTISFDHGVKVLLKFVREPCQMSNNCNIVVFVEDKGNTFDIDAKVVKDSVWMTHVTNTQASPNSSVDGGVQARSLQFHDSETSLSSDRSSDFERWSELPSLQKLTGALEVTIEVEYRLEVSSPLQQQFTKVRYQCQDFGILKFFHSSPNVDDMQGFHIS